MKNSKTIGKAFNLAARDPYVPFEIIAFFLSKLLTHYKKWNLKSCDEFENFMSFAMLGVATRSSPRQEWSQLLLSATDGTVYEILDILAMRENMRPSLATITNSVIFLWRCFFASRAGGSQAPTSMTYDEPYSPTVEVDGDSEEVLYAAGESDEYLKTCSLLQCVDVGGKYTSQYLLLHKMVVARVPTFVLLIESHNHREELRERDAKEHLPLHYAITTCSGNTHLGVKFNNEAMVSIVNDSCVIALLSVCPEAAQYAHPDGRLPLSHLVSPSRKKKPLLKEVEALIHAEPRALATRNVKTRFYPFMEAAATNDRCRYGYWNVRNDEKQRELSVVYTLLRSNPMVLNTFINRHADETLSEGKLSEAEKKVEELSVENMALKKEIEALKQENECLKNELSHASDDGSASKRNASWSPEELDVKKTRL